MYRWTWLAALPLAAQLYNPGPQVTTFFSSIDDTDQPYGLYLPRNYDPGRRYPLVVSLHGAYSNHRLNLRRVFGRGNRLGETDADATRVFPPLPDVDFIVVTPLARGSIGYQGLPETDVYDALADVRQRFSIDDDRIYLTGLSMGGGGAIRLALTRPDIWAAVAAVAPGTPRGTEELAGNALHLPVKMFQGDIDPVIRPEQTRNWHKLFLEHGVRSDYVEYRGVRHNSWDYAYRDAAIFEWFAPFRRVRDPARVRFATTHYKYAHAYWVQLDGLTPGTPARIDAGFGGPNQLSVTTSGLQGFTLRLRNHPSVSRARPVVAKIDGVTLSARVASELSFSRTAKGWAAKRYVAGPREKRARLEGPVLDALSTRHVYVYGTLGATDAEVRARRALATSAAAWSTSRFPLLLTLRTVSDREEKEFATGNLVLFGTKETNAVIAKYAQQLPIQLSASAADYGLLFVAPAGNRYAVVSSGLPWWTRADQARERRDLPFIAPAYDLLTSFKDFVLFRGGLDNVIAEGYFDKNWRVPPDAAARMLATGAVSIADR